MSASQFTGDKKLPLRSPLARIERRFIDALTPRFPRWIEGWQLTLLTLLWSAGLVLAGWLARDSLHWLHLASIMQLLQWFTDCFDGALGRHRDFGIPKWGYYMDHFLDYVFACCAMIGYSCFLEDTARWLVLLVIPIQGGFMVNAFLSFAATGEFKITFLGIGPTELRLFMVLLNTAVAFFGAAWLGQTLPYVCGALVVALGIVVFRTQKYVWGVDMADKARRSLPKSEN